MRDVPICGHLELQPDFYCDDEEVVGIAGQLFGRAPTRLIVTSSTTSDDTPCARRHFEAFSLASTITRRPLDEINIKATTTARRLEFQLRVPWIGRNRASSLCWSLYIISVVSVCFDGAKYNAALVCKPSSGLNKITYSDACQGIGNCTTNLVSKFQQVTCWIAGYRFNENTVLAGPARVVVTYRNKSGKWCGGEGVLSSLLST